MYPMKFIVKLLWPKLTNVNIFSLYSNVKLCHFYANLLFVFAIETAHKERNKHFRIFICSNTICCMFVMINSITRVNRKQGNDNPEIQHINLNQTDGLAQ